MHRASEHDPITRRFLVFERGIQPLQQCEIWLSCMIGRELPQPWLESLRSGEALCDLANAIRPNSVLGVTRSVEAAAMSEQRYRAKTYENIGK